MRLGYPSLSLLPRVTMILRRRCRCGVGRTRCRANRKHAASTISRAGCELGYTSETAENC